MKKSIALVLTLLLATALMLTACNQAETTDNAVRWVDGEVLTYNITLADYTAKDSSALFGNYSFDGKTYYKDMVISTSSANEVSPYSKDEVVPASASGTYTIKYTLDADKLNWTVTTEQQMQVTYNKTDIVEGGKVAELDGWSALANNIVSEDENSVTLKTSTNTSVTFENGERQRPVNSSTVTDGFYIGKTKVQASKSDVATKYDFDKNTATVTVDGKETTNTLKINASTRFIDANQLSTYIRSMDKGSTKFQDSPSVQVYVPTANEIYRAAFGFTYRQNCVITNGEDIKYVSLTSVNCSLGAIAFMQTQCLPDSLTEKGLDRQSDGYGNFISKYTVSRFRVGNFSYALNFGELNQGTDILDALNQTESSK